MSAAHELRALTSVRGLAAWCVVFFHIRFAMPWVPAPVMRFFAHGYLAVDFFFLLSGFVIWLAYANRLRGSGIGGVADFLKRRIARIWPLHLAMLACAGALALLFAATGRPTGTDFPLGELPLHILLIQNWGLTHELSWNDPAWSISCELAAYLLFPALVIAVDWRRVPTPVLIAAMTALLVLLHVAFVSRHAVQLGQEITQLGVLRCVIEFGCGTILAAVWLRSRERRRAATISAAIVAVALFTAYLASLMPETLAIPAAFGAALLALALLSSRADLLPGSDVLHYLGEISYSTYLGHFLLWAGFKLAFVRDATAVPIWQIAVYLALVLTASVALYHLIERPAQRRINRLRLAPPGWRSASAARR